MPPLNTGPIADALVREFLTRHGLTSTLAAFDQERPRGTDGISSRTELGKLLGLERALRKNKERGDAALKTCLEVAADFLNQKAVAARAAKPEEAAPTPSSQGPGPAEVARPVAAVEKEILATGPSLVAPSHTPARSTAQADSPPESPDASSSSLPVQEGSQQRRWGGARAAAPPTDELEVEDLDDLSIGAQPSVPAARPATAPQASHSLAARTAARAGAAAGGPRGKSIEIQEAAALKKLIFGSAKSKFNSAWMQGLYQNTTPGLGFGIVQTAGGPCGLIASVQAFMLRHLLADSSPGGLSAEHSREAYEQALARGLADILWQAGGERGAAVALVSGKRRFTPEEEDAVRASKLALDDVTEDVTVVRTSSYAETLAAVQGALKGWLAEEGSGVVMTLYSAILSRGIEKVHFDLEAVEGCDVKIMGAHNYCSQEMVNLLLVGRAVPNVFDGVKDLDGLVLTGIHAQGSVGLVTLFEHYKSMEVGEHLKRPKAPIWVVCSESHFTILFLNDVSQASREATEAAEGQMHLAYYDQLSKQDAPIKLSVSWDARGGAVPEDNLTPPLEHCIRTRWPGATVDWNGTDPIL